MPRRKWNLRISDILESVEKIFEYTQGMDFEQFKEDTKTIDLL